MAFTTFSKRFLSNRQTSYIHCVGHISTATTANFVGFINVTDASSLGVNREIRSFSNYQSNNNNRSPYAILNLKTSATTAEIKHSFRKVRNRKT